MTPLRRDIESLLASFNPAASPGEVRDMGDRVMEALKAHLEDEAVIERAAQAVYDDSFTSTYTDVTGLSRQYCRDGVVVAFESVLSKQREADHEAI